MIVHRLFTSFMSMHLSVSSSTPLALSPRSLCVLEELRLSIPPKAKFVVGVRRWQRWQGENERTLSQGHTESIISANALDLAGRGSVDSSIYIFPELHRTEFNSYMSLGVPQTPILPPRPLPGVSSFVSPWPFVVY